MNSACPRRVSLISAQGASDHSVSNHQRNDRGLPGCPAIRLFAYRPLCRLRLSLADSPIHADRIEFTATTHTSRLRYGLVVLVPLLSTPHCCDAVTVRYRTVLHRTEADFHRPIPYPSQAHERGRSSVRSALPTRRTLKYSNDLRPADPLRTRSVRLEFGPD